MTTKERKWKETSNKVMHADTEPRRAYFLAFLQVHRRRGSVQVMTGVSRQSAQLPPMMQESPITPLFLTASESGQQLSKTVQDSLQILRKVFAELVSDMASAFIKLPGELRPAMRSLADLGWFPSGEMGMSEIHAFRQFCDSGNKVAVDNAMTDWL